MSAVSVSPSIGFPLMSRVKNEPVSELAAKDIAERVVKLRKERGITQVELAKILGVTQPMISRLEKGEFRFNDETIVTLATLYKVSADEILGLKTTSTTDPNVSRRWLKRLALIEKLPKRDQDGLIQTVDRYLKASGTI